MRSPYFLGERSNTKVRVTPRFSRVIRKPTFRLRQWTVPVSTQCSFHAVSKDAYCLAKTNCERIQMSLASPTGNVRDEAPKGPNVLNVVLGNLLIKPWYPSFYPEDLVGKVVDRLYICEACFRYSKELMPYLAHMVCINHTGLILVIIELMQKGKKVCPQKELPPPGSLIYRTKDHSIYEVDGEEHKVRHLPLSKYTYRLMRETAILSELVPLREAFPGHQIRLLRCNNVSILFARPERSSKPHGAGGRLLQQGKDELGQQ